MPAEEGVEDVREAAEPGRVEAGVAAAARDPGLAEHVVGLAPAGIGQDLVGLVDLLEPRLRLGLRVDVGVPLLGGLAERALDRGVVGASLDAEDLVVVLLRSHGRLRVYGRSTREPVSRSGARAGGRRDLAVGLRPVVRVRLGLRLDPLPGGVEVRPFDALRPHVHSAAVAEVEVAFGSLARLCSQLGFQVAAPLEAR